MDAGIDMKGTLIQTDAAINQAIVGASMQRIREVVGINAMMRRKAIPSASLCLLIVRKQL